MGLAFQLQHHRAQMRTGQNVGRGGKRLFNIGRAQQEKVFRIAPQLQKAGGRKRAIFQCRIISADPEQRLSPHRPDGQAGGEPSRPPIFGEHFMQSTPLKAPVQDNVGRSQPQGNRGPVGRQTITPEKMAQIRQSFLFVHVMF